MEGSRLAKAGGGWKAGWLKGVECFCHCSLLRPYAPLASTPLQALVHKQSFGRGRGHVHCQPTLFQSEGAKGGTPASTHSASFGEMTCCPLGL